MSEKTLESMTGIFHNDSDYFPALAESSLEKLLTCECYIKLKTAYNMYKLEM